MKKAMAILLLAPCLTCLTGRQAWADVDRVAMVPSPLLNLPGMRALPAEIISDVSNAPNPFDARKAGIEGQTQISYVLQADYPVDVTLYDLLGHRVRRWHFGAGQEGGKLGANQFFWDGTNDAGQKVSKGGYLAQIEVSTPQTVATVLRKIAVIH